MLQQLTFSWDKSDDSRQAAAQQQPPALPQTPAPEESQKARAVALAKTLQQESGKSLRLTITDNSSTMMSMKPAGPLGRTELRLHHMFLEAPPEIRAALVQWIKKPRSRSVGACINEFIREHEHLVKSKERRRVTRTKGHCHDLLRIFREVNAAYFNDSVTAVITWGRMSPQRRRRSSIRFGSYSDRRNLIRIHPLLDDPNVPDFFVRYVVFHEMLHAHLGFQEHSSGRRSVHHAQFTEREAAYPDYERSVAWIEENLDRLLGRSR